MFVLKESNHGQLHSLFVLGVIFGSHDGVLSGFFRAAKGLVSLGAPEQRLDIAGRKIQALGAVLLGRLQRGKKKEEEEERKKKKKNKEEEKKRKEKKKKKKRNEKK